MYLPDAMHRCREAVELGHELDATGARVLLDRIAELERQLGPRALDGPDGIAYAVRWPAEDGDPEQYELHDDRESAERVRDRYRAQGAELVQAVRGPWTLVAP